MNKNNIAHIGATHNATCRVSPPSQRKKKKNQIFFSTAAHANAHEQKMASGEKCAQNIKFKLP
jgi:methylphosphotriester-DNA--protein-cysteine methyltransferase